MIYLLQHLLINSAKKFPDKLAVVSGTETLTYQELDDASNRLCRLLLELGVKNGDRVGIYINKSIPSIVSIYAILKAGAVYVPLDPQAPLSRLSYIIKNCHIQCLLTSTKNLKSAISLTTDTSLNHIVLTDDKEELLEENPMVVEWRAVEALDSAAVETNRINDDLAYIIYTSGSTGNPKGVMISHLNSLTFVNWAHEAMGVNSEDKFSSHAPLHFDLSIFDVFVTAKAGGTVYLVPETLSMFPVRLSSWIQENNISVWYSVPSILSMLVSRGKLLERNFSNLRKVIFAGEVFPVKYLRELMNLVPHPEYYNLYGPTETNVITYYKVPRLDENKTTPIPIGKCCENMGVLVIDRQGKLVTQPGEEGELVGRGTGVAKGYWGDEEKTNAVFKENPIQNDCFDRVYHTGDLVTIDEDGNYIYKGRIDHMIKSRGYRIELGEIEAAIYSHPKIKEATVIAIPDDLITNRIKAIVVVEEDGPSFTDIRTYCSSQLPKYMIPEFIDFVDTLPKTSTGKIDKQKLLKASLQ